MSDKILVKLFEKLLVVRAGSRPSEASPRNEVRGLLLLNFSNHRWLQNVIHNI